MRCDWGIWGERYDGEIIGIKRMQMLVFLADLGLCWQEIKRLCLDILKVFELSEEVMYNVFVITKLNLMTKSSLQDQYKIPAFQRKRSLAAKARKKNTPRTALDRLQAGVPFVKPRRTKSAAMNVLGGTRSRSGSVRKTSRRVVGEGVTETTLNYGRMRRASSEVREREALDDYFGSRVSSARGAGDYEVPMESSGYERPSYEAPNCESPSYETRGYSEEAECGSTSDDCSSFGGGARMSALPPSVREMRECGQLDGYFDKIQVAGIKVSSRIAVGDRLVFETADGLFEQELTSMQIDRKDVQVAYAGDEIGVKVLAKPSNSGKVYRVV